MKKLSNRKAELKKSVAYKKGWHHQVKTLSDHFSTKLFLNKINTIMKKNAVRRNFCLIFLLRVILAIEDITSKSSTTLMTEQKYSGIWMLKVTKQKKGLSVLPSWESSLSSKQQYDEKRFFLEAFVNCNVLIHVILEKINKTI